MNDNHDNSADDRAMLRKLTNPHIRHGTVSLDILLDSDTDVAELAEHIADWPEVVSVRHNGELLA